MADSLVSAAKSCRRSVAGGYHFFSMLLLPLSDRGLQKRQEIIILPADKGKTTVVLDKDDYKTKVKQTLSDTRTHEVLKKDPTPTYKRKLVSILFRL